MEVNPSRRLSTSELLDAVPVRNRAVASESEKPDEVVLRVPLRKRWYTQSFLRLLFPFSTHRRVALDSLGIEVWGMVDGRSTAERIVERFAERHQLSFHEARLSVMLFLRELTQRGIIVMAGAGRGGLRS